MHRMLQAVAYGGSVGAAESTASIGRQAEFAQIAASKLDAALSEREIEVFLQSLQKVIRARVGFTAVARNTGLNRTALYSILSSSGNPTLSTLVILLSAVGLRLAVEPLRDLTSDNSKAVDADWADPT
jgi:probable addiction module antidote protein